MILQSEKILRKEEKSSKINWWRVIILAEYLCIWYSHLYHEYWPQCRPSKNLLLCATYTIHHQTKMWTIILFCQFLFSLLVWYTVHVHVTGFEIICSNCPLVKCEHKSFWVSANPTLIECIWFNGWCKLHILIDLDKFSIKYRCINDVMSWRKYKNQSIKQINLCGQNVHTLWKGIYLLPVIASPSQRKQPVNQPDSKLEVKILRFFLEERVV